MGKQVIKENKHITAIFDSKALYDQHKTDLPQNVVAFVKSLPPDPIKECDLSDRKAWWIKLGGKSGLIIQGGECHSGWPNGQDLPIAFPNMFLSLQVCCRNPNSGKNWGAEVIDNSKFKVYSDEGGGDFFYIALGI